MDVGSLFVKLGLDVKDFLKGVKSTEDKLGGLGEKLGGLGDKVSGKVTPTISALEKQLKELTKQFKGAEIGSEEFNKLADEIDKTKKALDQAGKVGGKAGRQITQEINGASKAGGMLNDTMMKLGGVVAGAFAVDRIKAFASEAIKLAGEAQGVEAAFARIGNETLLQGLRDATQGTVSDLQLMKEAVKASNFKIPLESLGDLFEFARRRAKETGESVDFLVQSIVTGIGRKSPLILDNLGISATELKNAFGGAALEAQSIGDVAKAVGAIAQSELAKMGAETTTTADRTQQLTAEMTNLKVEIGQKLAPAVDVATEALIGLVKAMTDTTKTGMFALDWSISFSQSLVQMRAEQVKAARMTREQARAMALLTYSPFSKDINEATANLQRHIDALEQQGGAIASATLPQLQKLMEALKMKAEVTEDTVVVDREAALAAMKFDAQIRQMTESARGLLKPLMKVDQVLTASNLMQKGFRLQVEADIPADPMDVFLDVVDKGVKQNTERLKRLGETTKFVADSVLNPLANAMRTLFDNLIFSSKASDGQIKELELTLAEMQKRLTQTRAGTLEFVQLKNQIDSTKESLDLMTQSFTANIFDAVIGAIKQLISRLVAAAVAAAALAAIMMLVFPGSAAASKGFGSLFKGFFAGAAGLPEFANGGIVSGPTIGVMGEYAGARSNPEVIAPLNKLQSMIGGMGGEVKFRIEGRELVGVLSREGQISRRV